MSDRPEREWAAAKAMYELQPERGKERWEDLEPTDHELHKWLLLAQVALSASDEYRSRS